MGNATSVRQPRSIEEITASVKNNPNRNQISIFTKRIHISEEGEILAHQRHRSINYEYFTNIQGINDEIIKFNDLPPVLQAVELLARQHGSNRLLILTQEYKLMLIDHAHPRGIYLNVPAMRGVYHFDRQFFLLGQNGSLYHLRYDQDANEVIPPLEASCAHSIIENVRLISYYPTGRWIILLTYDNNLVILDGHAGRNLNKLTEIPLNGEVKLLKGKVILYQDNRIRTINHRYELCDLVELDYDPEYVCCAINSAYVIDKSNRLMEYKENGQILLASNIVKFIEDPLIPCVEDIEGNLLLLSNLKSMNFSRRLMNLDQLEKINNRFRNSKSSKK